MKKLKPVSKVFLAQEGGREAPFCGPGMIQLLESIDATNSVRKASEEITISYSKCWKLLRIMEECMGEKFVERRQGGAYGGAATLTEEGKDMVRRYRAFEKEAAGAVEKIFAKHFGGEAQKSEKQKTEK